MRPRRTLGGAAIALLVAALAATGAAPAFAAPPDGKGKPGGSNELSYAALGDSFAAGQGGGSYLDTSCYRSANSYPKLIDLEPNLKLTAFPACSGASTAEVIAAQVPAILRRTSRVTVTVGGNDLGFSSIMQNCFVLPSAGTCESKLAAAETMLSDGTLAGSVAAVIAQARSRLGTDGRVVVVGYPRLFDDASGYAYAARVNQDTTSLNGVLAATAAANGASFVDVEAAFGGHGIGSPDPWINAFSWFNSTPAFHPNATGYANYAALVKPALG